MPVVAATIAIRGLAACSREAQDLLLASCAVLGARVLGLGRSSASAVQSTSSHVQSTGHGHEGMVDAVPN